MVSKYHLENSLIYLEGSDIPHNKLGITDSEELHELERELLTEAYQIFYEELDDNTVFEKPILNRYIKEPLKVYTIGQGNTDSLI